MFATLRGLGWLEHPTGIYPQATKRQPARTVEQLVDKYEVRQPQRDVWVAYLRYRSVTLDYSSLKHLCYNLVGVFWSDIQRHHPALDTFAVTPEMLFAPSATAPGEAPPSLLQHEPRLTADDVDSTAAPTAIDNVFDSLTRLLNPDCAASETVR